MVDVKQILKDCISDDKDVVSKAYDEIERLADANEIKDFMDAIKSNRSSIPNAQVAGRIADALAVLAYNKKSEKPIFEDMLEFTKDINKSFLLQNEDLEKIVNLQGSLIQNIDPTDADFAKEIIRMQHDVVLDKNNNNSEKSLKTAIENIEKASNIFNLDYKAYLSSYVTMNEITRHPSFNDKLLEKGLGASNSILAKASEKDTLKTASMYLYNAINSDKREDKHLLEILVQIKMIVNNPAFEKSTNWDKIKKTIEAFAEQYHTGADVIKDFIAKIEKSIDDGKKDEAIENIDSITKETNEVEFIEPEKTDEHEIYKHWKEFADDKKHDITPPDNTDGLSFEVSKDTGAKAKLQYNKEGTSVKMTCDAKNPANDDYFTQLIAEAHKRGMKGINLKDENSKEFNEKLEAAARKMGLDVYIGDIKKEKTTPEPTPRTAEEEEIATESRKKRISNLKSYFNKAGHREKPPFKSKETEKSIDKQKIKLDVEAYKKMQESERG